MFDKNKLNITIASFKEAMALKNAVANALSNSSNVSISKEDFSYNAKNILKSKISDKAIAGFFSLVLNVDTSEEVYNNLMLCAKRASYGEFRINEDFFDTEEHRELYYPIMFEILKVNLMPFFKSLSSQFGGLFGKN